MAAPIGFERIYEDLAGWRLDLQAEWQDSRLSWDYLATTKSVEDAIEDLRLAVLCLQSRYFPETLPNA